jgi:hypothetical protein
MFDDMEHRYSIALVAITRGIPADTTIGLRGPFSNLGDFQRGHNGEPERVSPTEVLEWDSSGALPVLPALGSLAVLKALRQAPRFDADGDWQAKPTTEMHATQQKHLMDLSPSSTDGLWPVFKGESFDIWVNDRGPEYYYGWAEPEPVLAWLRARRSRGQAGAVLSEMGQQRTRGNPSEARVAFRDITNRTNQRTVIAALLPPDSFATHKAPLLMWPAGDQRDEAFLLGVMCSRCFDWYARRYVETNLTYFILNAMPVPRPPTDGDEWRRAVALAGRLAAHDDRFSDWADAVGVECGPIDPIEKQDMIDELDAVVAYLYGLSADQLTHIFETFHEGWDYQPRLEAVMAHFIRLGHAHGRA